MSAIDDLIHWVLMNSAGTAPLTLDWQAHADAAQAELTELRQQVEHYKGQRDAISLVRDQLQSERDKLKEGVKELSDVLKRLRANGSAWGLTGFVPLIDAAIEKWKG